MAESNSNKNKTLTAFAGPRRMASGPAADVAIALLEAAAGGGDEGVLVFEDDTGRQIDLDLRGGPQEIAARYGGEEKTPVRGPGRPKLGVEAREVTLLPRHWEWLNGQPGGASAALRRLVEEARRADPGSAAPRKSQESAYRFMTAMAGNEPGYEEAIRALFAGDRAKFTLLTGGWPDDIGDYARRLAEGAFSPQ
jgi:uncharacterized protein